MATESIVTSSREKSHLVLSNLFTQLFGDLSNLDKTSLNAWILERLTDIQRDLSVSMTLERSEQQLNTCRKISTARDIGYLYNFRNINTKPAKGHVSVIVTLPIDFKNQSLTIKADETKLYSGNICYMFPGDIEILSNENKYIQTKRADEHIYDVFGETVSDNTILYSTNQIDVENNQLLYGFSSEVIQVDYEENFFIIKDHLQFTYSENELEFEDNFYGIELWYTAQGANGIVKKTLTQIQSLADATSTDEVYTVEITDDNKLKVTLGNGLNGMYYASGKEIKYRIYTSKGTEGNVLSKEVMVGTEQDDLSNLSLVAEFNIQPTGGQDEFDLLTLKKNIIKKIQSSDNIITDNDFKNKLSDILGLSEQEVFQKLRRNDPIERIIELFMIVRDRTNENLGVVIPTNTLDISLNLANVMENNYNTIKPFFSVESITQRDSEGNIIGRTNNIIPSIYPDLITNSYYSTFYAIKIHKNPLLINFFNLGTNHTINLNRAEKVIHTNDKHKEVYINNAIIERNIFEQNNQYFMRLNIDALDKSFLENNDLIIKARFINESAEKKYEDFILDFYKVSDNVYEASFTSMDIISDSNNLFITDVIKLENTYNDGTEQWSMNTEEYQTEMVDNIACEIGIFYNFDTDTVVNNSYFANIRGVRTKQLLTSYSITDKINFYKNADNVMYCQAEYAADDTSKNNIIIKNIPLFEKNYLKNKNNKDALFQQMNLEKNLISRINNVIEFPSRLSLKYFNTYGYSTAYSSLENVSLYLTFEVSYRNNKMITESEISDIKQNLIQFINTINNRSSIEDKNIYLSDLVSIVTQNSNIVQCRVRGYGAENHNINANKQIDNIYYTEDIETQTPTSLQLSADNINFIVKAI